MGADRGRGLRELARVMSNSFSNSKNVLDNSKSILLGVTKVPIADADGDEITLDDIKDLCSDKTGLSKQDAKIIETLTKSMFIFPPLDKGKESWLRRDGI